MYRYIIDNYIARKWTLEDVAKSELFFNTHNVGNTAFPFPKDLFVKFVKENDGYFPGNTLYRYRYRYIYRYYRYPNK